jgi:hypothetical protein
MRASRFWNSRRFRWALAWTSGAAVVAALGYFGYWKLVEGAWIRVNKWDRRERGSLRVGHQAPDVELPLLSEGSVRLSELWRERPVFLVFGSCT